MKTAAHIGYLLAVLFTFLTLTATANAQSSGTGEDIIIIAVIIAAPAAVAAFLLFRRYKNVEPGYREEQRQRREADKAKKEADKKAKEELKQIKKQREQLLKKATKDDVSKAKQVIEDYRNLLGQGYLDGGTGHNSIRSQLANKHSLDNDQINNLLNLGLAKESTDKRPKAWHQKLAPEQIDIAGYTNKLMSVFNRGEKKNDNHGAQLAGGIQKRQDKERKKKDKDDEENTAKAKAAKAVMATGKHVGELFGEERGQVRLTHIILAILVYVAALGAAMSGKPPIPVLMFKLGFLLFLWHSLRINIKEDKTFLILFLLEIGTLFQSTSTLRSLPDWARNYLFNPFMPWMPAYIIILSKGQAGKISKVLYLLTVIFIFGLIYHSLFANMNIAFADYQFSGQYVTKEQVEAAKTGAQQGTQGVVLFVKNMFTTAIGGTIGFFNARIEEAGGEELFGEPKERPKLGIVIQEHPSKSIELYDDTVVKAILLLPNLPEKQEYMEVTDIKCTAGDEEVPAQEFAGKSVMKIFYNSPTTVTCRFPTEQLEKISSVEISVKYHFTENAKLITYIMRADLLDELRTKREDPLDFMAVPNSKRHPTTEYDNGPAVIGIGPIELLSPPFRIEPGLTYPHFEFVIGNKPDFQGVISKINSIDLTMPEGFSLDADKECAFQPAGGNKYEVPPLIIKEEKKFNKEIPTSRFLICNMAIGDESLKDASFAEIEFDANIDFTYKTTKTLSLR